VKAAALLERVTYPQQVQAGTLCKVSMHVDQSQWPVGSMITYRFDHREQWGIVGMQALEAENYITDDAQVIDDAQAYAGKAVVAGRKSKFLFKVDFPDNDQLYAVWVLAKGGILSLKTPQIEGDQFKQLHKSWVKSEGYTWRGMGSHLAADVNHTIYLMAADATIDRVLLVPLNRNLMVHPQTIVNADTFEWQTNRTSVGRHEFEISVQCMGQFEHRKIQIDVQPCKQVAGDDSGLLVSAKDQFVIALGDQKVPLKNDPLYRFVDDALIKKLSNVMGMNFPVDQNAICLRSKSHQDLPETVTLAVNDYAQGFSFLLAEYWQGDVGKEMAYLTVVYDNDETLHIPLREEFEISGSLRSDQPRNAICVATAFSTVGYNITMHTWANPHPDRKVKQIVFANDLKKRSTNDENTLIPMNLTRLTSQIMLSVIGHRNAENVTKLVDRQKSHQLTTQELVTFGTIDFNNVKGNISPNLLSINESFILNTDKPVFADYHKKAERLDCKVYRIHSGWTPRRIYTKDGFDQSVYENFVTGLKNTVGDHKDWQLMICINFIPKYMDPLTPEGRKLFAEMCADMVKRLNHDEKLNIRYWEIYNEVYFKKIAEDRSLWLMFNDAAVAMKKVDPNIKIGGYAPCWPSVPMIRDFYNHCHQNVDFLSWHKYLTGSVNTSTEYLMAMTPSFGNDVRAIRQMVNEVTPGKKLEYVLSEFNISWNWKPHEPRQATHVGSVWLASVFLHLVNAELDISQLWHSRGGGTFGLFGEGNEVRPNAHLFYLCNKYLKGQYVDSKFSSPMVETLGFKQNDQTYGLMVINKTDTAVTMNLDLLNAPKLSEDIYEGNALMYTLNEKGLNKQMVNLANGMMPIEMGACEVRFYVVNADDIKR
jgi:xylan 1,4-beta-xylosidase